VTKHDAERKRKILDHIAATLRARGYPPSVREIAKAVGLASTSAVHHHLQILEREGYLERGAAQSRAIRLTPTAALELGLSHELVPQSAAAQAHVVVIIGEVAAGGPIEAYQDASETMAVPDMLIEPCVFSLRHRTRLGVSRPRRRSGTRRTRRQPHQMARMGAVLGTARHETQDGRAGR
jgi:repressor LexA